jgi:N-acetylglucosaminyldiphosphoundecaprenol N-acetyl-beta-D-mannosaminyltransferase
VSTTAFRRKAGLLTVPVALRRRILGVPVDDVTIAEAVERMRGWAIAEPATLHQVVTVNPEYIVAARRDSNFGEVLVRADLATPDGVGVILAAQMLGRPLRGRATGIDLVEALAAHGEPHLGLFLLGAKPGIAEQAAARLQARYPRCVIAGIWPGSPHPKHSAEALQRIQASRANVLLVAYGAPEQDRWIDRHREELAKCGIVVAVGVGGTFDYLAGAVPRAPLLVRQLGFEWLYRLIRQPWRWRRQLALPHFLVLVLRERLHPTD